MRTIHLQSGGPLCRDLSQNLFNSHAPDTEEEMKSKEAK